jgi:hypothetical protein
MKSKNQIIDKLLTPSWLSALVAVAGGFAVSVGVIVAFSFNNSQVQQQLTAWQDTSASVLTLPGQAPPGSDNNSLQNTWPLLGFWAVIGLVVYFVVEEGIKTFHNADELRKELNYVHARRDLMIKSQAISILIRLAASVVLIFFIETFFKRVIPYSITAAHASLSDLKSFNAGLYVLLSFCMIALSLHLLTLLLRLAAGRPRLFSTS